MATKSRKNSRTPNSPISQSEKRNQARREYDIETSGINFTKDFNSSLEAVIKDPMATWAERLTAWLKRYSWGQSSLYAIKPDGTPRTLADAAKQLARPEDKLSSVKTRLIETAHYLESKNYLRRDGQRLYPVIDPEKPGPQGAPPPETSVRSRTFSEFVEYYKTAHSDTFSQLELARSQVKAIRQSMLSEYKKWKEPEPKVQGASKKTVQGASKKQHREPVKNENLSLLMKEKKERQRERAGGRIVTVVTEAPAPAPAEAVPARPPAPLPSQDESKTNPNPGSSETGSQTELCPRVKLWLNEHGRIGTPVDDAMLNRITRALADPGLFDQFTAEASKVEDPRKYAVYETVARQVCARGRVSITHPETTAERRRREFIEEYRREEQRRGKPK